MTDKEKLYKLVAEIKRRYKECNGATPATEYQELLDLIDSMQEEPVSYKAEDEIVISLNGKRHKQVLQKGTFSKNECKEKCSLYERCQNCSIDLCMIFFHDNHCHFVEEPVSEDLEEFINTIKLLTSNTASLTFEYGCREGAKWQKQQDQLIIELAEDHAMLAGMEKMKEQMMAKAVDAVVKVDAGGYPYIPQMELYDYDKDIPLAKEGDKYKVILIKEG